MAENQNPLEKRSRIISLLRIRGPSLPIHISRELNINTIFSGAFLSELASDKTIKISNMKVGSSPLYFLPGQEQKLENFSDYLPGKEKEAFLLLKDKKILQDTKLEPAIRVALRSIKDFAFPFVDKTPDTQVLFWRFHSFTEEQVKEFFEKTRIKEIEIKPIPVKPPEIKPVIEIKPIKTKIETKEKSVEKAEIKAVKKEVEKPLITIKEKPVKKLKEKVMEKSEFVKRILSFLTTESIEITEEKEAKKKEFTAVIRVNSDIGKIKFLCIAKDKKSITENDLTLALQKSQSIKMPAFLLSTGNLNKKALSYIESYSSLIKFRRI